MSPPVAGVSLAARLAQACVTLLEVDGASITLEAASPNRVTLAVLVPAVLRLVGWKSGN